MSLFASQRFLVKIAGSDQDLDLPPSEERYKLLTPGFKFYCSHKNGFSIQTLEDGIELQVGDLSLLGFRLFWSSQTQHLKIRTDDLALYPILAFPASDGGLWLSNTSAFFPRLEKNYRLNPQAVEQFFTRQCLLPGQFLVEGVRRISGEWECHFPQYTLPPPEQVHWKSQSVGGQKNHSAESLATALRESLEQILNLANPTEFRMSGGADSRLISLLFNPGDQRGLVFRTTYASWLDKSQDLDYQITKKWCENQSWTLQAQPSEQRHSSVFDGSDGRCLLSGLYGAEYLGGMWEKMLEVPLLEPLYEYALSPPGEERIRQETSLLQQQDPFDILLLSKQVLTHSDRGYICRNVRSGWSSPLANIRVAVSPFAVLPFLKKTLQMPEENLHHYKMFTQVLSLLEGQDRHFPVCSQLNLYCERWLPPEDWGIEPKSRLRGRPMTNDEFSLAVNEVLEDLQQRGILLSPERIQKNIHESQTFRRLMTNFFYAFPRKMAIL